MSVCLRSSVSACDRASEWQGQEAGAKYVVEVFLCMSLYPCDWLGVCRYMHIWMYEAVSAFLSVCWYECSPVCVFLFTCVCPLFRFACLYLHICLCISASVCVRGISICGICLCMGICCVYIWQLCVSVSLYVFQYIKSYMVCVCVCVSLCVCISTTRYDTVILCIHMCACILCCTC